MNVRDEVEASSPATPLVSEKKQMVDTFKGISAGYRESCKLRVTSSDDIPCCQRAKTTWDKSYHADLSM